MVCERELKFQLPDDAIVPLAEHEDRVEQSLEAVYYDTDELRLARFGSTLRFRNDEGWCVKLPGATEGVMISRREVLFPGAPGHPPDDAVALVSSLTRGAPVTAVAAVSSQRRAVDLGIAELVDDKVVARAPNGALLARFRELELELAPSAELTDVQGLIGELTAMGAVPGEPVPKLARALGPRAMAPADVAPPSLLDEPTLREVIQHALGVATYSMLLALAGARLDEDPEDVHQARVSIRRFRSHLRVFRAYLDRRWAARLNADLRRLGAALGEVRDLDVMTATIEPMSLPGPGADEMRAAIATDRIDAYRRLVETLNDPWCAQVLEELVDAAADPLVAPQADDPAGDALVGIVAKPWRQLRKTVRALPSSPPDEALHEVRILAKRCRYAADAVRPVVGAPAKRLSKRAAAIQDSLGYLNDASIITAHLEGLADHLSPTATFTAGQVSGILVERAIEHELEWRSAWRATDRNQVVGWLT